MAIKFIILGCGSSMGIPRADGFFGNCDLNNKKNYRTRCSAIIKFNNQNILIDTSPDLRHQLLSNNIKTIDKVFYTHLHADQTHGINDLRPFFLKKKKMIPVYSDNKTSKYLYTTFKYCFKYSQGYPATLELKKLKKKHVFNNNNNKILIENVSAQHGNIKSICYILNKKLAYASDVSLIYENTLNKFKNLDYFIIDCLWYREHPSHYNLDKVLKLIDIIKPKKTILTNMHSDLDYMQLKKILPNNVIPGYDGLSMKL